MQNRPIKRITKRFETRANKYNNPKVTNKKPKNPKPKIEKKVNRIKINSKFLNIVTTLSLIEIPRIQCGFL